MKPLHLPDYLDLPPVMSLTNLPPEFVAQMKAKKGVRIGFTCGAFDLFHPGHLLMMRECLAKACHFIFVGLQEDPSVDRPSKNPPSESLLERRIRLEACKYVGAYGVYNTEADLLEFLRRYARSNDGFVDVRMLDQDYMGKPFTGHDLPIDQYFNSRDHELSTSELRRRIAKLEGDKAA